MSIRRSSMAVISSLYVHCTSAKTPLAQMLGHHNCVPATPVYVASSGPDLRAVGRPRGQKASWSGEVADDTDTDSMGDGA